MTEQQIARAAELIHARDEILEFLTARDPNSDLLKVYAESKYEHVRNDGIKLPKAEVAEIQITDARRASTAVDEEPDTLAYWYIPRDVLERALTAELVRVTAELLELGVQP